MAAGRALGEIGLNKSSRHCELNFFVKKLSVAIFLNNMRKLFWTIVVLVILIIGGLFLRQSRTLPPPAQTPVLETIPAPDAKFGSEEQIRVKEFTIAGTEFAFNPSTITVKTGEKVRVTFRNVGNAPHDWTIEGLGLKTKVIGSGREDALEFTAPASGAYTVYCSVPGHREAGMVGSLVIE